MSSATQRSAWTPKTYQPDNEKMFVERMTLIKKWFTAWNNSQQWTLVEYILQRLSDPHLVQIYNLLGPLMPPDPPPPQDFTRVLPRVLSLKIFSYLDPKTLSRAAQVCWYWKYLCDSNALWRPKCLRHDWFLPQPPLIEPLSSSSWKTHYVSCVSQLHWTLPNTRSRDSPSPPPSDPALSPSSSSPHSAPPSPIPPPHHSSLADHCAPWRDPDPHPDDLSRHTIYMTSQQPKEDYAYLKISAKCLPRLGKTLIRRGTHPVFHSKTTPRPQWPPTPQPTYATTNQPSPPQPTMHPTLQQKLRLGSPTPHHKFSAINCKTTGRTSRTDLHEIPLASPFPKLPAHFSVRVASTGHRGWDNGDGDGEAAQSGTKKCTEQSKGAAGSGVRSSARVLDSSRTAVGARRGTLDHVIQLPSQPWVIPEYSDEDNG